MRSMESTTANTKSKEIEQRFDTYRKRKRHIKLAPSNCEVAVISATNMDMESSSTTPKNNCTTDAVPSATASNGFISVIGRRRVMEDAVRIVPGFVPAEHCSGGYDFFAVYDGHGGNVVAYACRDRLHLLLAEELKRGRGDGMEEEGLDWHQLMYSCFMKMDRETGVGDDGDDDVEETDGNTMGSTATVVVVGKAEIVVANCGDSRAVLCRGGVAVPLSRDHKPDRPDEKERIEAAGGRVINWNGNRVLGVLATSRSIGDHCMKPFVTSQPEIKVYPRTDSDEFVVVASDGLWDVVSNSFACEVVRSCFHGKMKKNLKEETVKSYATEAAALLAELAMARGSKDNISVIVIHLKGLLIT